MCVPNSAEEHRYFCDRGSDNLERLFYDHDIDLRTDRFWIPNNTTSNVILTITNLGGTDDLISLFPWTESHNLAFSIFDEGIPIINNPVAVPAYSSKDLLLVVTPQFSETSYLTISAVSLLDPTATDLQNIIVTDPMIFLPVVFRN